MGYPGRKYRQETGQPLPNQSYGQPSAPPPQGLYGEHMSVPLGSHSSYSQPPNHNQYYNQPYGQPSMNQNYHMPGAMPNPGGMPMPGNIPGGMPLSNSGMPLPDSKYHMPDSRFPMPNGYPQANTNFNAPSPPPYPGQTQFNPQAAYPPPQGQYEYDQPQNQYAYNQPPSFQTIPSTQPVPNGFGSAVAVSNFSGRKKAVLIGINYYGTKAELRGCINDVKNVTDFICRNYGFSTNNIVILTDDQKHDPSRMPTRANILQAMQWLVSEAHPNDSLFFHFSGHGSQREDKDGDEDDGFDETICPVDYDQSGDIVDDEMNAILVQPLPQGCRLTAIFDCCHSGTALDLPYLYDDNGNLISYSPTKKVKNTVIDLGKKYLMGDMVGAFMSLKKSLGKSSEKNAHKISQETKGTLADVIMFSGCKDSQTSADAHENGVGHTGAMSFALIKVLSSNPHSLSYIELLARVRSILKAKYTQVPQLSSGRPMDMNSLFNM